MGYEIIIPSLPFLGAYIATYALYKGGLIKKALHINLWNFILMASFIISGGAGFLLMILMEMGIVSTINFWSFVLARGTRDNHGSGHSIPFPYLLEKH